jgi:hypothetical protein
MRSLTNRLLSVWWISWFGFIGAFLIIGGLECTQEISRGAPSPFSLTLLIVTSLSWAFFFVSDAKAPNREPAMVSVLTTMGTILTIFTDLGIFYFVDIAPRVQ